MISHHKPLNGLMSDHYKKMELYTLDVPSVRLLMYIVSTLKPKRNEYVNSQTIELKPTITGISRNGFFSAIKTLSELNILTKVKPHTFIVNPGYHCCMNNEQRSRFNYDLECYIIERSFRNVG